MAIPPARYGVMHNQLNPETNLPRSVCRVVQLEVKHRKSHRVRLWAELAMIRLGLIFG
jgi:hypothetical protein